jgi:holo-[acyl-carrier protein] synthase
MAMVGLGLDVCSVERIRRVLAGPRGERFLARVYTEAERVFCGARSDAAAAYAARFAAKEALMKAMGAPKGLRWRDIEVVRATGAPQLRLSGVAGEELHRRGARTWLALSHDGGIAAATVVLEDGR